MLLACILDLDGSKEKHLTLINFAYSSSFHSSIGMPPYEALHGKKCKSLFAKMRWKIYVDRHRRDLEFEVGDFVFLKVSPWKRVFHFGKKGKLSLGLQGIFEVLERIGTVAYLVAFPPNLSRLHNVFHVLVIRKYVADLSHMLDQPNQISQDMTCEEHPLKILNLKQHVLRTRVFSFVKVQWRNHPIEEATWEREEEMKEKYHQLFETQGT
ncbi:hypothetical protein Q3G72_022563 [Acer saccharum]|nr:hypothetical protein Q3G72_022563 [Acer saccharum]